MRRVRLNHILSGTVLALVLAGAATAAPDTPAEVEAAIPLPEPANVPPPTAADFGVVSPQGAPKSTATPGPGSGDATPPGTATNPDARPTETVDVRSLTGKDLIKAPISSGLEAAEAAVAAKLRDLLANKLDKFIDRKNERAAVEVFYRDRGFAPLWTANGAPAARASAAIAYLHGVEADGLDPADYPTPDFVGAADPDARAAAEIKLTDSVLTFARHARTGRVHFTRVSGDILYKLDYPDPSKILAKLAASTDVRAALDSYNPQQPGYKALKAKLAELRGSGGGEEKIIQVPDGPTLVPGMEDTRVSVLRKRLNVAMHDNSLRYSEDLVEAVKSFQASEGLRPDGLIGPTTLKHLNTGEYQHANVIDTIIANMERWRWLPRDLGTAYVMLNIPDYTLKVVDNGVTVWSTKVVVGKPGRWATPIMSDTMKFITVNPTWNVPPSIVNNEYLPALRQDPSALDKIGLKVVQNRDGTVHIYQPPGERNALGRLRFNFPNKFLVYQHDTPDKYLFTRDKRAYSHGCMRVQNPDRYAEVLLSISNSKDKYTVDRIHKMYGGNEENINFAMPIPVHLTYQTAFVDETGKLMIREDIYGRDAQLLAELKGDTHKVADQAIERRDSGGGPERQVYHLPARPDNPFGDFFGRLFR